MGCTQGGSTCPRAACPREMFQSRPFALFLLMAPFSQEWEPPQTPGRFNSKSCRQHSSGEMASKMVPRQRGSILAGDNEKNRGLLAAYGRDLVRDARIEMRAVADAQLLRAPGQPRSLTFLFRTYSISSPLWWLIGWLPPVLRWATETNATILCPGSVPDELQKQRPARPLPRCAARG